MSDGFGVNPDEVVQHASDLRASALSRLANAAAAAEQVGIGDEVYGLILSHVIPPAIEAFCDDAGEAINKTVDFGDAIEAALTGTAMDYYSVDQESAKDFETIAEAMGA